MAKGQRSSPHLSMHKLGVFVPNEGTTTRRLPDVLFIVVGVADDTSLVRSQARRAAVFDGTRIGKTENSRGLLLFVRKLVDL